MKMFVILISQIFLAFLSVGYCLAESKPLQVDDYLLNINSYQGQTISVIGYATCFEVDQCELFKSPDSMNTMMIFDPTKLPKQDRKDLLQCNLYNEKCFVTISGISGDNNLNPFLAFSVTPAQEGGQ
jgi:hypothetical protein